MVKPRYKIVSSRDISVVEKTVVGERKNGYVLYGPLNVTFDGESLTYTQALIEDFLAHESESSD